ncbi:MAG: hypothetical protein JJE51_10055 [Thermoanaerobaculia bacterium]|nr:hypothetical protein [Thermoanaerobaculia bacterium]
MLKQIFGILLDARQGFHHLKEVNKKLQLKLLHEVPGATAATLDESPYFYSDGPPKHHPDDLAAPWLHGTTQGELKRRNLPGGVNDAFIGNMALVTLYAYWEHHYRERIASALGLQQAELKVPVLGDIRLIRNSILHHRAIALADLQRCEVPKWFRTGEPISISTDRFRQVAAQINEYLDRLVE